MKTKLLTSVMFILLFSGSISKLYAQNELSIVLLNGTNEQISINSISNIKFSNNDMNIYMGSGLTSAYNFSSIRKLVFKSTSGVNDLSDNASQIQIYPNPVNDILYFKNARFIEANLIIYSLAGVAIRTEVITSAINSINVSELSKGFYILKLNNQAVKFSKL